VNKNFIFQSVVLTLAFISLTAYLVFIKINQPKSSVVSPQTRNQITPTKSPAESQVIDPGQTIPDYAYPIGTKVFNNTPNGSDRLIIISIDNPFDIDVNAKLTQNIPPGLIVGDSSGGVIDKDVLTWQFFMPKKTFREIRIMVFFSNNFPSQGVTLKGAILNYSNLTGSDTYTAKDVLVTK